MFFGNFYITGVLYSVYKHYNIFKGLSEICRKMPNGQDCSKIKQNFILTH